MEDLRLIEYRVRPITRYIVTRYEERVGDKGNKTSDDPRIAECRVGRSEQLGAEYDNLQCAFEVASALCSVEHSRLGFDLGDQRIRHPLYPTEPAQAPSDPPCAIVAPMAERNSLAHAG